MAARFRILPLFIRLAVYAAAVFVVVMAPAPHPPPSAAALRATVESPHLPEPSLVRFALIALLLAGVLLELAARRARWR